ncbi:MAG: RNA polymerase sigma factor [Planctomycetota bacterium]
MIVKTMPERSVDLGRLYEEHKEEVFGFLIHFLGDRALAEDVLQESFLKAFRSFDRFERGRDFRPWLHQIVRNCALDAMRRRRKERGTPRASERVTPDSGAHGIVVRGEDVARARAALDALPDETRLILLQRHGLGMKVLELAEVWGLSERTMRYRLEDAAAELAAALAQAGERESGK